MLMPQSITVTLFFLNSTAFGHNEIATCYDWFSVLKLAFSVLQVSELKNMENMICFKYGAIIYFTFNILYETYDCILQYVHFFCK